MGTFGAGYQPPTSTVKGGRHGGKETFNPWGHLGTINWNYRNGGLVRGYQGGGLADLMPPEMGPEIPPEMMGPEMMGPEMMGPEMMGPVDSGLEGDAGIFDRARQAVEIKLSAHMNGQELDPSMESELDKAIEEFVNASGEDGQMALASLVSAVQAELSGEGGGDASLIGGPGDGMSDSVPGNIDGEEEVRLSSGEVVIPADAVSGLGNGDTESGAQNLMDMVDRIRQARTGSPVQSPQVNPNEMMPV